MKIQENVPLAPLTTFKIGGNAAYLSVAQSIEDLKDSLAYARTKKMPFFVLGGGSNILISDKGFLGLVIKIEIKGISKEESSEYVIVTAGAGEAWDDLVSKTVEWGAWGLENLSAIPGTVGASPVQNIGAYGTEVMDSIESVYAIDAQTGKEMLFSNAECGFSYRDSIFKKPEFKKFIITSVSFRLSKAPTPNISYKDVKDYFSNGSIFQTQQKIREAVMKIRAGKFPDLKIAGTAGSFWKNPLITKDHFDVLLSKYPQMPSYPSGDRLKIPLGWILDNICKLKGYSEGNVSLYMNQALVLVALPGATRAEISQFAEKVKAKVKDKTGIDIETEVEWVG